ncbi:MAG: sulfate adenylyltransferase subunit CysN [Candidatus Marinimicrobia bacterium]|jgi:bifunctional enzyme CysN/CysC|nr:sulfate adenylyltransferase subunit CysN [Candidatus Neomarinimicrobiota bacterium]MBT7377000.1 sulfate adenylyltransferase subunit CysN [Candidatus Neomarinimicrobiota bacterium]|tara:strand:+ start:10908 stop:12782 length:1875 start_codon:yes stop_codon:yes gene_type:complete
MSIDVEQYLVEQENKQLLRFITCGSVDDGKSTLIGRLLYESQLIFDDQLAELKSTSKKVGTQGDDIDFALLVDGLAAEMEQGITIDVAYRFFSTDKRKFIVADTPGHEQYTRNMATGASTADVAILLVDARAGLLPQTCRHSYIVNMLGVKNICLAINKMDLVDYSQEVFERIKAEFLEFSADLNFDEIVSIPVSALKGDNIINSSTNTQWYEGDSLIQYLENVKFNTEKEFQAFTFPVQWVNRLSHEFRGFCGLVAEGSISEGDEIVVKPSNKRSNIKKILVADNYSSSCSMGQSVTIELADEIDVSRGNIICHKDSSCDAVDQFQGKLLWMDEEKMVPGRPYIFRFGVAESSGSVSKLRHRININTFVDEASSDLELNEIGIVNIALDKKIVMEPYVDSKSLGSFIVIDKMTNNTVGMGLVNFALRRGDNVYWHNMEINRDSRSESKNQKPVVLWFTGLSGSGKSTIANIVEKKLYNLGKHTMLLDGDNVRHGLNKDLGFTDVDRVENIRRIANVSKLMLDAGLITIVSFIAPFKAERDLAKDLMGADILEVFIDVPIEVAESRDPKGLYKKARSGDLKNFTGIDSPYEKPENPDIHIESDKTSAEDAAELIVNKLIQKEAI